MRNLMLASIVVLSGALLFGVGIPSAEAVTPRCVQYKCIGGAVVDNPRQCPHGGSATRVLVPCPKRGLLNKLRAPNPNFPKYVPPSTGVRKLQTPAGNH